MDLQQLRQSLADHPGRGVRFVLEGGRAIADHFHVTEVGRVQKDFIDCGGVSRSSVTCVLQTLVAGDTDHRLTTDKLAKILATCDKIGLAADTPVEVEHQERSVSIDGLHAASPGAEALEFTLRPKQTACLAEDACGIPPATDGLPVLTGCCDDGPPGGGCC